MSKNQLKFRLQRHGRNLLVQTPSDVPSTWFRMIQGIHRTQDLTPWASCPYPYDLTLLPFCFESWMHLPSGFGHLDLTTSNCSLRQVMSCSWQATKHRKLSFKQALLVFQQHRLWAKNQTCSWNTESTCCKNLRYKEQEWKKQMGHKWTKDSQVS